jgi:hypothetical protein
MTRAGNMSSISVAMAYTAYVLANLNPHFDIQEARLAAVPALLSNVIYHRSITYSFDGNRRGQAGISVEQNEREQRHAYST